MARPCTQNVRVFRRELSDDQRKILLAAGDGDTTIGFNECLALWASIHGLKASLILNVPRETIKRKRKSKYPGKTPEKAPSVPPDPMQNLHNPMHSPHEG